MDVAVMNGKREVPGRVRAQTEEKIGRVGRLLPVLERAQVHFTEEHNPRIANCEICEVTLVGHGIVMRAHAAAPDALAAVDLVVEKLERQAVKMKGRVIRRPAHRTSYRDRLREPLLAIE